MTKVSFKQMNDGWLFDCEGHSGYAEKGGDIVCAGVSALCMALSEKIEELSDEDIVSSARISVSDGEIHIYAETNGDKINELLLSNTVETVMAGFRAIENRYPQFVVMNC